MSQDPLAPVLGLRGMSRGALSWRDAAWVMGYVR